MMSKRFGVPPLSWQSPSWRHVQPRQSSPDGQAGSVGSPQVSVGLTMPLPHSPGTVEVVDDVVLDVEVVDEVLVELLVVVVLEVEVVDDVLVVVDVEVVVVLEVEVVLDVLVEVVDDVLVVVDVEVVVVLEVEVVLDVLVEVVDDVLVVVDVEVVVVLEVEVVLDVLVDVVLVLDVDVLVGARVGRGGVGWVGVVVDVAGDSGADAG